VPKLLRAQVPHLFKVVDYVPSDGLLRAREAVEALSQQIANPPWSTVVQLPSTAGRVASDELYNIHCSHPAGFIGERWPGLEKPRMRRYRARE